MFVPKTCEKCGNLGGFSEDEMARLSRVEHAVVTYPYLHKIEWVPDLAYKDGTKQEGFKVTCGRCGCRWYEALPEKEAAPQSGE